MKIQIVLAPVGTAYAVVVPSTGTNTYPLPFERSQLTNCLGESSEVGNVFVPAGCATLHRK